MPEIQTTSEFFSFFRAIEHSQRTRESRIEQYVRPHLESGALPTPDDVRNAINSLVGDRRQKIMRYHKFSKERTLRQGLDSLVHAAHQASIDVCRHDAALGALADSVDFQSHVDRALGHAAQKDVVAYCALAFGVRDTLKEVRALRDDIAAELSEIEDRVFSAAISEFVRKLRNNLLHGRVVVPQWSVSFPDEQRTATGSMMYSIEALTASGDWNAPALDYMQSCAGEHLPLAGVVREHFVLVGGLKSKVDDVFAKTLSLAERDYWHIEDSHKRDLRRQWMRILVGQAGKGKDPYDHLHRFFAPEALREVLRRPQNSKEQVDFIIALKSAEIDFDDELRQMMYRVFGVVPDAPG